jgi:hypothetical protein
VSMLSMWYINISKGIMSPVTVERGVMWVCYLCDILISVKVSPLLCFQDSKVWTSALEECEYQHLKKTEKQWHLI